MKKLFAGMLVAGTLALSPPLVRADVDEATARALLQDTGIWSALEGLPEAMTASLGSATAALPPELGKRMTEAAGKAFSAEPAKAVALDTVRKGMDAATIGSVRQWNESALGKRLIANDKATANQPPTAARLAESQAALEKSDPARRKAFEDILDASKAVDQVLEMSLVTSLAMMQGIGSADPAMAKTMPPEEQMRTMMKAQLGAAVQQARPAMVAALATLYATFSTEELQHYAGFLRSPAGSKYKDVTFAAFVNAMKAAATQFGAELSKTITPP